MKFLHTADWHLGAKTNGRDRLPEQKRVLDEILSIANHENIDCVIVAGDVFNTASPSAEAEELFFDAIEKLSNGGDRFVFVLAGNHDDPTRLVAGLPLASKHNIALVSSLERLKESTFVKGQNVSVVETGKGYIKIKKNEEIVTIAYLPYPSESRISEKLDGDLEYADKVQKWAEIGASAFSYDAFNIFVSHLFMVGSKLKDGEVKVGDILAVPKSKLPKADYTALGHLHTPQHLGDHIYYSGAITELDPRQKNLGVNIFESENGKVVSVNTVKLQNTSKFEKITAHGIESAKEKLEAFDNSDIIELELVQESPLASSEIKALKKAYPCLSNIVLSLTGNKFETASKTQRKFLSDAELFTEFYKSVRGTEPAADLTELFISCKGEEDETN